MLPSFRNFVSELRHIWETHDDDEARMQAARKPMQALLADPDLQEHSNDWPTTEGRKNLLFYEDPDHGFVINGVVREPGRRGGVHDHDHAWVLYGVLLGEECLERYERVSEEAGVVHIRKVSSRTGRPGTTDIVPPYDLHAEQRGPARSVAMILRSTRVAGKVLQGSYNAETGEYRKVEGPEQIPYELSSLSPSRTIRGKTSSRSEANSLT